FQAEDGIRDGHVTGVQTCALPISASACPGASLRCGLQALPEQAEAAVVVLGDGPNLNPEAIDRVIATWREDKAEVVAATYAGVRLHPVLLTRSAWKRVPDEGARTLDAVLVSCDDLGPPGDVDFADEV